MNKPFSAVQSAIKGLAMGGLEVVSITDDTPVPHNGCRPRKARRMWPPQRDEAATSRANKVFCYLILGSPLILNRWRAERIADGVNNERRAGVSARCRDGWHTNESPLWPQALGCLIGGWWGACGVRKTRIHGCTDSCVYTASSHDN